MHALTATGDADDQAAPSDAKVDASLKQIDGERYLLRLEIAEGYHINSHDPSLDSLIATRVESTTPESFQVKPQWPATNVETYPYADRPLAIYTGAVEIPLTVRFTGGEKVPAVVVTYQACTDTACLAPQRLTVEVD